MKLLSLAIIQGLLEMTGTIALAFVLARIPFSWKRAFLLGLGLFGIIQAARYLPLFFGFHTLVGLLALTVSLVQAGNVSLVNAFVAAFFSLFILGLLEFLAHAVILSLLGLNPQTASRNPLVWKLIGMPQGLLMLLLAWSASKVIRPRQPGRQNELPQPE